MQDVESIGRDIDDELPDRIQIAFDDLSIDFDAGKVLHRARIHDDRTRKEGFQSVDLRPPPREKATPGRANREGRPVLYLASSRSTALAEVRAWKGAAVALAEVTTKRPLFLVDLSRARSIGSPFFDEQLKWRTELAGLLRRLAGDMSRPVMPHKEEVLYKPTQLLALLIKSSGYDGFIYPSAMGSGTNVVLFNADDVEIRPPEYVRVKRAAYFSEPLDPSDEVYEKGPYDFALERKLAPTVLRSGPDGPAGLYASAFAGRFGETHRILQAVGVWPMSPPRLRPPRDAPEFRLWLSSPIRRGAERFRSTPTIRLRSAQQWQARHPPRYRGTGRYSPPSCARAGSAPLAGCRSAGRLTSLSFA